MNSSRRALIVVSLLALYCGLGYLLDALADPVDPEPSQGWTITTWNDLGMHCMDEDFSIFAILPPFNTLDAELIDKNGNRVDGSSGVTLYYQAAPDPDGSETRTSVPQTNFWQYADLLFGANLPGDTGLLGNAMPGISNTPQPMHWDAANGWWAAEGIPIIPNNQFGIDQPYPLVRVTARNAAGTLLADTLVTAPVSAEMNCISCHASGALGDEINRASCYQCHPGKQTKCLRGAMGRASDHFGQPLMSCHSCHGGLAEVGAIGRQGWLEEPDCQSCHTGTYTNNVANPTGQLRFTSAFLPDGSLRTPADPRFATTPDSPLPGTSLYRFSKGHGDLTCSACHGSPHAVYPTNERNDNIQSLTLQGHVGTISDCNVCHQNDVSNTRTVTGGPHGMHGINEWWIKEHHDYIPENNDSRDVSACNACHGLDSAGGVLSKALGPRAFNTEKFGTVSYWQGQQVSCYDCHDGPNESDHFNQAKPVVQSFAIDTEVGTAVAANLLGSDADTATLSYRIVDPPQHGTIAISGATFAYTPAPGFAGTDYFTYAARDDRTDSNLGRVNVDVGADAESVDLDNDGLPDIVERAFGLSVARTSRGTAPEIALCEIAPGEKVLQAIYDPNLIPPDLSVVFEVSSDLENWSATASSLTTSTDAKGRIVKRAEVGAETRLFLRYRVERQ